MKKFNMLIEAIYFGTSPKIFKDFKLKIETEGLDAFGKIHKTLNASKNISLTKWDD